MKQLFTFLAIVILSINISAQAPQKLSYQAVIRNGSNALVSNSTVGMKTTILQGSASGTPVYVETQTLSTNANGLVSVSIGTGTVVSGSFATIDWSNGPFFIKTETDPAGGISYSITGTTELLSVPYALYAGNVVNYIGGSGISISGSTISSTAPRIVAGTSSGGFAPTILNGSGFSVTRTSSGTYSVTFTSAFTSVPTVVASPYNSNNIQIWLNEVVKISNVTTTGFIVYTGEGQNSPMNAVDNLPFAFIATGN